MDFTLVPHWWVPASTPASPLGSRQRAVAAPGRLDAHRLQGKHSSGREGRRDCGQIMPPTPGIMELAGADAVWALGVGGTARKVKNHKGGEQISKILAAWRNGHVSVDVQNT